MNDNCFLDTNILVYAHDTSDHHKRDICQQLIFEGIQTETAAISVQVLNEFFVTVTRKIKTPLPPTVADKEIQLLQVMRVQEMDYNLVTSAIQIHIRNLISYWDSLIIAAAKRSRCSRIYTEDLNHGQTIDGVQIINPFL